MEQDISEISMNTPTFSAISYSLELVPTLSDIGRQHEIAVAVFKTEVVITQERHDISPMFQRILEIFDHAPTRWSYNQHCTCPPTLDRQPYRQPWLFPVVGRHRIMSGPVQMSRTWSKMWG